jgi:hypothetical protein
MKKIKLLFLVISCVFACLSCGDMLKEEPYGVYSNDNFYQTENDALTAVLYAYDPIANIEYAQRFLFYMADVSTNQCRHYDRGFETFFYTWEVTPNTNEFTYFFKSAFLSINRANEVLVNVEKMTSLTSDIKNRFLGEGYFLRAFNYFMLVRAFGRVPMHKEPIQSLSQARSAYATIPEIYEMIISDLEQAIALMPIAKQQGRVDKVGAQSLLAKVYLTLASSKMTGAPGYEWVSDAEDMYTKAAEYAGEVVTKQNVYRLDPDLGRVYDVEHQADGIEHIFITSMSRDSHGEEGNYSQLCNFFTIGLNGVYISKSLEGGNQIMLTGAPNWSNWAVMRVDDNFYDSFDDADLRKKLMVTTIYNEDGSVRATYAKTNNASSDQTLFQYFYPFCRKYTDPLATSNRASTNCYLMRFAEVVLTYAEALGPTQEGYAAINAVRARAKLDPLPSGLSIQQFREAVWQELTYELFLEGRHLFELRRTHSVLEKITNKTVKQEYAYFFPIPQRELDLNPQNN